MDSYSLKKEMWTNKHELEVGVKTRNNVIVWCHELYIKNVLKQDSQNL